MSNIIRLHDLTCPDLIYYYKFSENQLLHYYEPDPGLFIAESPNVIERALLAGFQPLSFLTEEKYIYPSLHPLLSTYDNVPIYTSDYHTLTKLTGFHLTKGMLCLMKRKNIISPDILLSQSKRICVLENVMNPTNIGAIFRSAAALSIDAVLLTKGCSDPFYRRTTRVSMGTVFQIPWSILGEDYILYLKKHGFTTLAMALDKSALSLNSPDLPKTPKMAIVLGSEGYGLSPDTINLCDHTIYIPMSHDVDSLNVAAASAVAFWEFSK